MEENKSLYHTLLGAAVASTFATTGLFLAHYNLETALQQANFEYGDLRDLLVFGWDSLFFLGGATVGSVIAYNLMPKEEN